METCQNHSWHLSRKRQKQIGSPRSPYHLHPTCEDLVGPPFLHALHKVYLESPDTTGRCIAVGTSVVMPSNWCTITTQATDTNSPHETQAISGSWEDSETSVRSIIGEATAKIIVFLYNFTYIYKYLYIYILYVRACVCASVAVYVCVYIYIHKNKYIGVYVCVWCLSLSVSLPLSVSVHAYLANVCN